MSLAAQSELLSTDLDTIMYGRLKFYIMLQTLKWTLIHRGKAGKGENKAGDMSKVGAALPSGERECNSRLITEERWLWELGSDVSGTLLGLISQS